jgi:hypothetical protein
MKYMLLLRFEDGKGPEEGTPELDQEMQAWGALMSEMDAAGVQITAMGLDEESTATIVRKQDGETVLSDGPYAETKEHLFSFIVIDVADLDEAVTWAERAPNAEYGSVEVRPLSKHEQDG